MSKYFDCPAFFGIPSVSWALRNIKHDNAWQCMAICAPAHLDDDIVDVWAVGLPQPSLIAEVFWNESFLRREGTYEFSRLQKP